MRFRTVTILPLVLLLGLFSISPWRGAALEVDSAAVFAGPYGVGAQWVRGGGGSWIPSASMPAVEMPIEVRSLFKVPVVRLQGHMRCIIIPWWIVLPAAVGVTWGFWRLAAFWLHRQYVRLGRRPAAFPVSVGPG